MISIVAAATVGATATAAAAAVARGRPAGGRGRNPRAGGSRQRLAGRSEKEKKGVRYFVATAGKEGVGQIDAAGWLRATCTRCTREQSIRG